jgi:hypothetical protein
MNAFAWAFTITVVVEWVLVVAVVMLWFRRK